MRKRKKSKKGKRKSKFPHQLTIDSCSTKEEEIIITDAGFERIDCRLALQYFSLEEIFNYWECYLDFEDVEAEEEIEKFEELMSTNYYSFSESKQQEFLELLISQCSWLPTLLDIATARAVYGLDYRWVKVLALLERYEGLNYIDSYEEAAIRLGLCLRKELGNYNLSVVNDNKHAVANLNGIISFEPSFMKYFFEFTEEEKPTVFWGPRKFVKLADRLSIHEATRVFAPDDDFFELDAELSL